MDRETSRERESLKFPSYRFESASDWSVPVPLVLWCQRKGTSGFPAGPSGQRERLPVEGVGTLAEPQHQHPFGQGAPTHAVRGRAVSLWGSREPHPSPLSELPLLKQVHPVQVHAKHHILHWPPLSWATLALFPALPQTLRPVKTHLSWGEAAADRPSCRSSEAQGAGRAQG